MSFLHVCLNATDAGALADWYTANLDFDRSWEFTVENDDGDAVHNVYVADEEGVELQFSDTEGEAPTEPGDAWDHFAIEVDDVDTAVAEMDHHGIVREPADYEAPEVRAAFVEDPDGHVIELIGPMKG